MTCAIPALRLAEVVRGVEETGEDRRLRGELRRRRPARFDAI